MRCHSCGADIAAARAFELPSAVSSDCQPVTQSVTLAGCDACGLAQKDTGDAWRALCAQIYRDYRIYHQAAGREQKALGLLKGSFAPRSELLVEFLSAQGVLGAGGQVIDIGCGNGAFLRTFHAALPDWRMAGTEINATFRNDIEAIAPDARFFDGGEFEALDEAFDLVTLIHCLEHVPGPVAFLAALKARLADGAALMIQVPDAEANPFDLVIADHCTHFSPDSLRRTVEAAGYDVIACGNLVLGKEVTLLARPRADVVDQDLPAAASDFLERNVAWLRKVQGQAESLARSGDFSVFGSSIAATWIGAMPNVAPACYLDDDSDRVGGTLLGAPIVASADAPKDMPVFVPLAPALAEKIAARLRAQGLSTADLG